MLHNCEKLASAVLCVKKTSDSQAYEYQNDLDLNATQAYEWEHDVDQLLLAASQEFKDDELLLAAVQEFEIETILTTIVTIISWGV